MDSWVEKPKHPTWGFKAPKHELVKIIIDIRPKLPEATYGPPPQVRQGPSLSAMLSEYQIDKNIPTGGAQTKDKPSGESRDSDLFRQENWAPGSSRGQNFHPFGNENVEGTKNNYFGGPILDMNTLKWRGTHYTRVCGDVIGAEESNIPLPPNMSQVVKAVAIMSSKNMTQSALWIAPRLLISTLHLHQWIQPHPSYEECDVLRRTGQTFSVEGEICSQVMSALSPKVQLVEFSPQNDIGIFRLQDQYPPRTDYLDINWLLERDEALDASLKKGEKAACIGYSGKISAEDEVMVRKEAAIQLQNAVHNFAKAVEPIDLDIVTKPTMKSFAPGTVDAAEAHIGSAKFGVSASLWKGSSGGPCILLEGERAGAIIGLVQGYDLLSDPYNTVNGFPNGLKKVIRDLEA